MNKDILAKAKRTREAMYLEQIAQPASAREVAARLGVSGVGIGGIAAALSGLVRRGLAKFEDGKFTAIEDRQ